MLQHLYEKPPQKAVVLILLGSLILSIMTLLLMYPMEVDLKRISSYGVIDLEFMWDEPRARQILDAWGPIGIQKELFVTCVDYLYMLGYSFAIGLCDLLLLRACDRKSVISARMKPILPVGVILPFVSAGFDAVENINLLIVLLDPAEISPVNAFLASLSASMKFGVLFLGLGFLLFTLWLRVFGRAK